jgi:hypothetical protein
MLGDLRRLGEEIASVLSAAEALEPVVGAWLASQRPAAAANGSAAAGAPPADAPAATEGANPAEEICPECKVGFKPVRHGGQQQRFCSARCRGAAHQRRRRARAAAATPAAEPPAEPDPVPDQDLAQLPDVIERPLRGECKVEDPRAAILAQAAALPWERANGGEAPA